MFGLNSLSMKIMGGMAIVVILMGVRMSCQDRTIEDLNKSIGGYERQTQQLAADLTGLVRENRQLHEYNNRLTQIQEATHDEQQEIIRRLEAEAAKAARALQEDPDARVWLDTPVPDAVSARLQQLFPAGDHDDGVPLPGSGDGDGAGHADAGVARGQ